MGRQDKAVSALPRRSVHQAPLPSDEVERHATYARQKEDYRTRAEHMKYSAAAKRECWKDDDFNTLMPVNLTKRSGGTHLTALYFTFRTLHTLFRDIRRGCLAFDKQSRQ